MQTEEPIVPKQAFLDNDGVLADIGAVFLDWLKHHTGKNSLGDDAITHWSPMQAFGIPYEHTSSMWDYVWRNHRLMYDGAEKFINALDAPEVVTTRPQGPARDNLHQKFNLQLRSAGVTDIHIFNDWKGKERFLVSHDSPDAFVVEDNLEFLLRLPPLQMGIYLLDRPWNKSLDLEARYVRVYSYDEILERIR